MVKYSLIRFSAVWNYKDNYVLIKVVYYQYNSIKVGAKGSYNETTLDNYVNMIIDDDMSTW